VASKLDSAAAPVLGGQVREATSAEPADHSLKTSGAGWRGKLAGGLYHSGFLRFVNRVSRQYELNRNSSSGRLRGRKAKKPKFLILCYHRVGTGGVPLYSELAPEIFEAQMRYLKNNFRIVPLQEVYRDVQEPSNSEPGVAVTFDDGYRDLYRHAFPVLTKYRIPATVFLIADCVDSGQPAWYDRIFLAFRMMPAGRFEIQIDRLRSFELGSWASRLRSALEAVSYLKKLPNQQRKKCSTEIESRAQIPCEELEGHMLDWEQIRAMQMGGVAFGSHTVTHPVVSRLTVSELEYELTEAKKRLEEGLQTAVPDFAFPFGGLEDCGPDANTALRHYGYRSAVTTFPGVNVPGTNPLALRRIQIGDEHASIPMFAFHLSKHFLVVNRADETDTVEMESAPRNRQDPSQALKGSRHA
jgi:peptidoglycan/xylan/chitin deacetylase (PgdA/CDA1 family)